MTDESSLREVLKGLANECSGIIGYAEPELRRVIGNTNLSVLILRVAEAKAALATQPPASSRPARGTEGERNKESKGGQQ